MSFKASTWTDWLLCVLSGITEEFRLILEGAGKLALMKFVALHEMFLVVLDLSNCVNFVCENNACTMYIYIYRIYIFIIYIYLCIYIYCIYTYIYIYCIWLYISSEFMVWSTSSDLQCVFLLISSSSGPGDGQGVACARAFWGRKYTRTVLGQGRKYTRMVLARVARLTASSVHAVRGLICTRGQGPRLYTRNGFAVCTPLFLQLCILCAPCVQVVRYRSLAVLPLCILCVPCVQVVRFITILFGHV